MSTFRLLDGEVDAEVAQLLEQPSDKMVQFTTESLRHPLHDAVAAIRHGAAYKLGRAVVANAMSSVPVGLTGGAPSSIPAAAAESSDSEPELTVGWH